MKSRNQILVAFLFFLSFSVLSLAQSKFFTVQVQALDRQEPALALIEKLKSAGWDAYYLQSNVPGKGMFYRVRVGRFSNSIEAKQSGEKLRRALGINDYYVTTYENAPTLSEPPIPAASSTGLKQEVPGHFTSLPADAQPLPDSISSSRVASAATAPAETIVPPRKGGQQFGDESGWEIYLAGGGSFWSHQDTSLSIRDVLKVTPDPSLPNDKLQLRQSFANGGKLVVGVVKNINNNAALDFSYAYGTSNFTVTALEDGSKVQLSEVTKGMVRSLGMRSHYASLNYRHSVVNNEHSRVYLTGGFHVAVFTPNNDGLDKLFSQIPDFDPADFKQKPSFKTVAAPGVNFGAGVIVKMSETVGLRFDVRDYMTFTKRIKGSAELKSGEKLEASLFGNALHNLVPTVGLVFTPR